MKKLFFFILSVNIFFVSAMEKEKLKINVAFRQAVENAASQNPSPEDLSEIKKYLELGADINYTSRGILYGEAAIIDAVEFLNKDLFDFLLQNGADINYRDNNERTLLYLFIEKMHTYQLNPNIKKFDIEKDFLKRGADSNIEADHSTSLTLAIRYGNIDLIKLLIKYSAKINEKDRFKWTPLRWAIDCRNFEVIKELCDLGASLVDIDDGNCNAFHFTIKRKLPKNYINLFITNSRFDSYNKDVDEQLKTTVKTALLTFNQLKPTLPKEIQFIIFSYLALNYLYDSFNKKLCQQLVGNKNAKNPILTCTFNKVNGLEEILQSKNKKNKTALQILHDEYKGDTYIQEVESLVNVEKLQQDRIDFIQGFTRQDNLVAQIYTHNKNLLFKQYIIPKKLT